ncbi:hypothetical protein HQ576_00835 [bacterium]|nr:hypothetical protein [bacterium]
MPAHQEKTCLACHGDAAGRSLALRRRVLTSSKTLPNVDADFRQLSRHPLSGIRGGPRRSGIAGRARDRFASTVTSVTCTDCHDAHYQMKSPKAASGNSRAVKQIRDARGRATPEYVLCYRCHGSKTALPGGFEDIQRRMNPSNRSYHPVEATGRNRDVPSLIRPRTEQSILSCSDCHGSSQPNGPRGPHGSVFEPILKAHYEPDAGRMESTHQYALCYRCHSRGVLFSANSFPGHKSHVVEAKASCHTCHDSHGSRQYPHLIDFDTRVVSANSKGRRDYQELGARHGSCSLRCHEHDHVDERY